MSLLGNVVLGLMCYLLSLKPIHRILHHVSLNIDCLVVVERLVRTLSSLSWQE